MTIYCFILVVFFSNDGLSQHANTFSPAADQQQALEKLQLEAEKDYKQTLTKLPSINRKDYEAVYKQRWENIKDKFEKKKSILIRRPINICNYW